MLQHRLAPLWSALLLLASAAFLYPATVKAEVKGQPSTGTDKAPVIVAFGDSLTAGYGLADEESYPSLLQAHLKRAGYPHRVINAGVSGDTSAGGLARLDWVLQQPVQVMILCLGGNDGLRGSDPEAMRANLDSIIVRAQKAGATVILAGMHMPTNYGPEYTRQFDAVFPTLAKKHKLPFLPFLLEGVAAKPELNQADGIHPTAKGAKIVEANVWKVLKPVLDASK
jgi:acyl-CoA thioesterase I